MRKDFTFILIVEVVLNFILIAAMQNGDIEIAFTIAFIIAAVAGLWVDSYNKSKKQPKEEKGRVFITYKVIKTNGENNFVTDDYEKILKKELSSIKKES